MALDAAGIVDAVISHALASGLFETVSGHEPKKAPGTGITAAVWLQSISPVPTGSGLTSTTGRVELRVRIYQNMLSEPQDDIDPAITAAVDALMTAYSGDFTFGGRVRNVDLLGQAGAPLGGQAGYLPQDGKLYRVFDITLPVVVSDLWTQAP